MFSITTPTFLDVVFIRTAVTFDTLIKLPDTFFNMLAADIGRRMLMTSIAGIATVIIIHMAGSATCLVVAVQHKIFIMIKACRLPFVLRMATAAITRHLLM
jgi:hypothetical protein